MYSEYQGIAIEIMVAYDQTAMGELTVEEDA
jgi:hypothetical protein